MMLLKQVRIIDPNKTVERLADILIIDDEIKQIAPKINQCPSGTEIINQSGLVLGTGLTDLYSHSGEPGHETRETLAELTLSAAAGGFTQVGILPDTQPPLDNLMAIKAFKQHNLSPNSPQLRLWGPAYDAHQNRMYELGELQSQIVGFITLTSFSNLHQLNRILEYLQPWSIPLAIDLHQNELAGGVISEGAESLRYGINGIPECAESAIIAAVLEVAAQWNTCVHIMRVSTIRGVELIARAKARGLAITASTTWMHLLWDSDFLCSYDPNLRLHPPLGTKETQKALVNGVKAGIIDAIAIDHQGYTYEEKTVPFALAPPGVIGLELALALLWDRFVSTGEWTAQELWQALSHRPRKCLHQKPWDIISKKATDLILFDPNHHWIANQTQLASSAFNTPWYQKKIPGKVKQIWVNTTISDIQ